MIDRGSCIECGIIRGTEEERGGRGKQRELRREVVGSLRASQISNKDEALLFLTSTVYSLYYYSPPHLAS